MSGSRKDTTGQDRAEVFNHELLRSVRLDLGLSQEEIARSLGIDVRTYRRYESGEVSSDGKGFDVRNASRRQLLRKMCDELGVADEDAWLVPRAPIRAQSHALLRAPHFVGREDVLRTLDAWTSDENQPTSGVLAIIGVGGAGKTAVIERFVARFRGDAWVHSFYDDPRTEAAVRELSSSSSPNRVVVLDGVESVQSTGTSGRAFGEIEDPSLRRALRGVCAGIVKCRKVIVTSRFPLTDLIAWQDDGSYVAHSLGPLATNESIALLRAWGIEGDDASLSRAAARSGGHALSIAMVGSYVGTFLGGDPQRMIPDNADVGDDATTRRLAAVLDSYASALTKRERDVMAHLSIFAGAADVGLLADVCGGAKEDDDDDTEILQSVARLERLGLVAKTPQGITAHPFVRDRFKRLLGADDSQIKKAHAAIGRAIEASLEGKPNAFVREEELLDRYEALLVHTLSAGRAFEAWGIYRGALGGFANLGLRLGAMARGARVLAHFDSKNPLESAEIQASLLYDRGLYACALGDLAVAARMHDAHLATTLSADAGAARAMGLRTRAYVAWLTGDLDAASAFLEASRAEAAKIPDERGSHFHLVRAHSLEAIVAHDQGDEARATRALDAAHALEARPTSRRALWEAEILLTRGGGANHDRARELAESAITECARRGWLGHVAHGHSVLGLIAAAEGKGALAREHLERAKPWVESSNEVEMALRCEDLAAQCGDVEAARRGLALAETHGFRRFALRFRETRLPS